MALDEQSLLIRKKVFLTLVVNNKKSLKNFKSLFKKR